MSKWQPIATVPKDGTKVFLLFTTWDYAPIASFEFFEGGSEYDQEFNESTYAWCFKDDSFGSNGDGWLYAEDEQPIGWMNTEIEGGES